jgi:hypothetical protein
MNTDNTPAWPEAVMTTEQEEALWSILLREGPPDDAWALYEEAA